MHSNENNQESLTTYRSIRELTTKIENLSHKIDELYQVVWTLENLIERVGRYCVDTYSKLK